MVYCLTNVKLTFPVFLIDIERYVKGKDKVNILHMCLVSQETIENIEFNLDSLKLFYYAR